MLSSQLYDILDALLHCSSASEQVCVLPHTTLHTPPIQAAKEIHALTEASGSRGRDRGRDREHRHRAEGETEPERSERERGRGEAGR